MLPRSSYKQDLKENRQAFLEELRTRHGTLPKEVEDAYLRKMIAIQNETRGKLGELIGEVSITASGRAQEATVSRDSKSFRTPFGLRRIDVWDTAARAAIEVKSGYACLNRFVRLQIKKDAWILAQGLANSIEWRLLQGGSRPLRAALKTQGFSVHLGWPDLGDEQTRINALAQSLRSVATGELS